MIPKIKKKLDSFLTKEEGKISKKKLLSSAAIVSALTGIDPAVGKGGASHYSDGMSGHANAVNVDYAEANDEAQATHGHSGVHSSHSSHNSHCNSKHCG